MKELGWQTLEERRLFHSALLMYKAIHGLAPNYICDQVTLLSDVAYYDTRRACSLDVVVPKINKDIFRKSFAYYGAITWNKIPDHVRRSDDLFTFKERYKKLYFE